LTLRGLVEFQPDCIVVQQAWHTEVSADIQPGGFVRPAYRRLQARHPPLEEARLVESCMMPQNRDLRARQSTVWIRFEISHERHSHVSPAGCLGQSGKVRSGVGVVRNKAQC
jgi:hypothetical protein